MKEFGALFVSGHLVSSIFLLPLMGLYFSLGMKRMPPGFMVQFHKILVLLSIILPMVMVLMAAGSSLETNFSKGDEASQALTGTEPAVAVSNSTGPTGSHPSNQRAGRWPAIQDVVFYFVDLILLFSLLGLVLFALRYTVQTLRLKGIKQDGVVSDIEANCRLIESIRIRSPFSVGFFRKSIFIPKDISEPEKKVIVQHELNHFRCRHHAWSLLETLLACLFWFNPMVHILRRRGAFLRELECDGRTIQKIDRYEYTRLLVKTAESMAGGIADSRFSLLTQGWARKGELKKRIENLMNRGGVKAKAAIGVFIAAAVVVTVGITLLYGNLNDATKEAILAEVHKTYQQRAPLTERVELEQVPPHFINALLVNEDSEFFEHKGIRLKSIFRAAGENLKSFLSGGRLYMSGGSTITQQLAKQFIDNPRRTLKRKFEELKIARTLEAYLTKEEILEMYLNMVYFGNGAFGLKAASETYFEHDYSDLTLPESAMLVPFLKAPSTYNMLEDPIIAGKRQERLLERMESAARDI